MTVTVVRLAEPADEEPLFALLTALAADNNSFGDELDERRIREHIQLGTERRGGLHGVIDGDGELAASIGIIWDRWWYAKQYMLSQIWLFVRPAYRHFPYERELIEWAKQKRRQIEAGAGQKVPLAHTVISQTRLPTKLRLWRRRSGSEMIGGVFLIR